MTAKLSRKQIFPNFDVFCDFAQNFEKYILVRFWYPHKPTKKQIGFSMFLKCFLLKRHDIIQKVSKLFHQGLVSFHPTFISPHIISPHIHFTPGSFHPRFISPQIHFTPCSFRPTFKLSNESQINN